MKVVYIRVKVKEPPDDLEKQLQKWGMHICGVTDAFKVVMYDGILFMPGKSDEVSLYDMEVAHEDLEQHLGIPVELLGIYLTGRLWDARCGEHVDLHPKVGRFVTEEYPL